MENNKKTLIKNGARKRVSVKDQKQERDIAPHKLKLLFTIVDRQKGEFYADVIQSFEVNMQIVFAAEGTASDEILGYLGLASTDKALIISAVRDDKATAVLSMLEEKFRTVRNGKGVAFTVPMTSTIGTLVYKFLINSGETRGF
ncbi:MAG: hypothetical protein IJF55_01495 [Clostridia bacterium]|nr:hypothetical protein [Clostridia bacterium]